MRRTPPAVITPSPWAATILPAAAPRRPSRFSRSDRTAPEQGEPTIPSAAEAITAAEPWAPQIPSQLIVAAPVEELPAPAREPAKVPMPEPAPMPAPPPPVQVDRFGIPIAPPSATPPTQVDRFGIPIAPPSATPPTQVDRFGIPIAPPSAPMPGCASGGYPPPTPWTPAPSFGPPSGSQNWAPPPPANGWPTSAKVVIGIVAGFIAFAILAAIAIPVFLNQRQKPANRPVSLPATLLGDPQLHDATLDQANSVVLSYLNQPGQPWTTPVSAYYGQDTLPAFSVAAAKLTQRPTPADETNLFRSVAAHGGTLTPEGSGPFGGEMECGPMSGNGISTMVCASVDSAAFVETVLFGSVSNSEAALLSRQIISAVEGGPSLGSIGSSTL